MSGATGARAPVVTSGGLLSFFGLGAKPKNANNVEKQLNNVRAISVQPAPAAAPAPAPAPAPAAVSTTMSGGRRSRKNKSRKVKSKARKSKAAKSRRN